MKLLASSNSLEGLIKLIERFYYGTKIKLNENGSIQNSIKVIKGVRWVRKGNRFRFEGEIS